MLASTECYVGGRIVPLNWLGETDNETSKSWHKRLHNGFFSKYCAGEVVLDIGYSGGKENAKPVLPWAVGIDEDYPNYNGIQLPFEARSVDTVYASHVFEHLSEYALNLLEWYRVLKLGGFLVMMVPHKFLYERAARPPSVWNMDHYRFYTPANLLATVEEVLTPNCYRVRHCADNDDNYDYALPPNKHPVGCYEIELVLEKIALPQWRIAL